MLDALIYHPRRKHCKNPFGAVPLGTQVRFSAGLPAAAVRLSGPLQRHLHRSGRAGFGVVFPALSLC